jgi:NRPS condensation-like uncharacterized protein
VNNIPDRFSARMIDCFIDYLSPLCELMIQLEMKFDKRLDVERLSKAVDLILDAEPVLGCRYVDSSYKPFFERLDTNKRSAFFPVNGESEYEAFKSRPIDHKNGPQVNVCLWRSSEGDCLLLKVSHLASDARGVKDISAILSRIYHHLSNDRDYRPLPNIKASRSIRQLMRHVPLRAYPHIYMNSLRSALRTYSPGTAHTLSIPDGPREPLVYVNLFIPSSRVSALAQYGRSRDATLNDIIMSASLRALADTEHRNSSSYLSFSTTIDLRRYAPPGNADAAANLSAALVRWPDIGTEPGQTFAETLERVAKITRYGKAHWIGLEILIDPFSLLSMVIAHKWQRKQYNRFAKLGLKKHGVTHSFTNLGPIDTESVTFGIQPSIARVLPPPSYPLLPFLFSLSGYNGTLTLSAGAYPTQKEAIEKFFDAILKELPV